MAKLEIKLNCSNRRKLEEIEWFKDKKERELNRVRCRLVSINEELNDCRLENTALKRASNVPAQPVSIRRSLL